MNILEEIVANKRIEIDQLKARTAPEVWESAAGFARPCVSLKQRLAASDTGIIAEFKRRSPSKGFIKADARVADIVPGYAEAGACGISVLQDAKYFAGGPDDMLAARPLTDIPLLYKEFVVDEYQLTMAKGCGADAVLLIAAVLSPSQCRQLADKAHQLGLETLLELHSPSEVAHIGPDIDIVGINNRNLKTFEVDIQASIRLCHSIPDSFLKISESGLSKPETVVALRREGFRGFLMGENFMKTDNPPLALANFIGEVKRLQND